MLKRLAVFVFTGFMSAQLCGCALLTAQQVEAASVTRDFPVSYSEALAAVKQFMQSKEVKFKHAVIDENTAKVSGQYSGDNVLRIFIYKLGANESRIKARVGANAEGREAAQKVMDEIAEHLK